MERLANNIANRISLELNLTKDNKEIIAYGTFALLQIIFSISLVFLFGLLFHVAFEALIISFTGAILRKYSGGVHASSPSICTFIGIIICVVPAVILTFVIGSWGNLNLVIIFGVIIFIWSYYKIYKLAPVDSAKKPIKREEKRKRMKKSSVIVLILYLTMVVLCILIYVSNGERKFLVYSSCIYVGILWQTFTLTDKGHLIMSKVDNFFSHTLVNIRR